MNTIKEVTKPFSALGEMIFESDIAMVATSAGDGSIRSRPMATSHVSKDGEILFFSVYDTELLDELKTDAQVNVTYRHESKKDYVSVSGIVDIIRDKKPMELFWKDDFEQWIPDGFDNPKLVMLKVTPLHAEHWGSSDERKRLGRIFVYGKNEPAAVFEQMGAR